MRVATVDGLVTLYYDGSKPLFNGEHEDRINEDKWETLNLSDEYKRYWKERFSWQQIIVVEGVREIPTSEFSDCDNIKTVIFADTVTRIERSAFHYCRSLTFIKLSINLVHIGSTAFSKCDLSSIFLPPRCREIGSFAFADNKNLNIFNIPQDAELGHYVFETAKFLDKSPFPNTRTSYDIHAWMKNINDHEDYALHRACSSYQPLKEVIVSITERKGLRAFAEENSIGITPSQYLKENPYADIKEKDIIRIFIMKMMG